MFNVKDLTTISLIPTEDNSTGKLLLDSNKWGWERDDSKDCRLFKDPEKLASCNNEVVEPLKATEVSELDAGEDISFLRLTFKTIAVAGSK